MNKKVLPPAWLLIAIILMVALHLLIPVASVIPPLWNLLGLVPLALGIALDYIADRVFLRAQTTVKPFEKPSRLVTWGVFRLSRNPMYLGFVLVLAGVAVLLGSLTPFLIIPLFFAGIDHWYITYEEQALEERFGPAWLAYKASTRRWF